MARTVSKTLVLAVYIVFGLMLITGCEEEEKISDTQPDITPDAKRSRLIAVENAQLKQQIEELKVQHAGELKRQQELNDKEIQKQQKLLDDCKREKAATEEITKKGVENYMQEMIGPLTDENTKLQEEIETLKAQIEKLKTELEDLKKPKVIPLESSVK